MKWLKYAILRRINRRAVLRQSWVQPVAPYLEDRELWRLKREAIARGLAAGLFFGLLMPVAQFFFAAALAVLVRGNLAVAALATFVSNPLTVAPIYWAAYRVGGRLFGVEEVDSIDDAVPESVRNGWWHIHDWLVTLERWWDTTGQTMMLGLFVIALASAVVGYLLVKLLWRDTHRP